MSCLYQWQKKEAALCISQAAIPVHSNKIPSFLPYMGLPKTYEIATVDTDTDKEMTCRCLPEVLPAHFLGFLDLPAILDNGRRRQAALVLRKEVHRNPNMILNLRLLKPNYFHISCGFQLASIYAESWVHLDSLCGNASSFEKHLPGFSQLSLQKL